MNWLKFCVLLVLATFISFQASARVLRWTDCVQLAIEKNPDLKANQALLNSTAAQEGVAFSGFYPAVNISTGFNQWTPSTYDPTQDQANSIGGWNTTFKLSQNIYNGQQDYEKWLQAKSNTVGSNANLQISKASVSYSLKSAYEAYIYAKAYQKLTSDIIRRRQENLRIVELRFQSGRENKGSVLLSRANLNQARFDDLHAKNLKEVAKAQLRQELGLDDGDNVEVEDEIPLQVVDTRPPNFANLVEMTPTYRQTVATADAAAHGVKGARGAFLPQLALSGEYGTVGNFYPPTQHWIVGLNLSLNLLNGGKDYSNLQSLSYTQTQNESQAVSAHYQGVVTLRQSFNNLVEAIEKLKVDESFKEAAVTRAEIARRKYNNGLLSFEDWDIIENDLIFREKNFLGSTQARVTAEAQWERDQGTGAIL